MKQIEDYFSKLYPDPSAKDIHNQAAEHITASLAFLLCCQEVGSTSSAREELGFVVNVVDFIQRRIKAKSAGIELMFEGVDRTALLAALCSQIRSCKGLAYMLELDIEGALKEMTESDHSRLGEDGQPIFSDANKMIDGQNYRRPNYIQFT